jgi:metal transporter CNNM
MGQDIVHLRVVATSSERSEGMNAGVVLWLLERRKHRVLVTLILGNVVANETSPIVLDRSLGGGGGWPAMLGSTVLVGKARRQLNYASISTADRVYSHLQRDYQSVCAPYRRLPLPVGLEPHVYLRSDTSWPTAKLLDWLLGEDQVVIYMR